MQHFFTKDTVEASLYCRQCVRNTMWTILGGRPAYCQVCYAKSAAESAAKRDAEPEEDRQQRLW